MIGHAERRLELDHLRGLNQGRIDTGRLQTLPADLPLPRFLDGRLVPAVDASPWLRSDASCSAERLFCHVYGRAKSAPRSSSRAGRTLWPYSFVAALFLELDGDLSWRRSISEQNASPSRAHPGS
ncbi:transposase [Streptomyces sp. NPDC001339]|uniref:transposase n=1 Tax=Streptomyces sp. NPDC001339 TaxID=3364563 RepID=UPI00367CB8CA